MHSTFLVFLNKPSLFRVDDYSTHPCTTPCEILKANMQEINSKIQPCLIEVNKLLIVVDSVLIMIMFLNT